jgi:hypothetical protein
MRNRILGRTGKLALVMGAALLYSATAFAGTPTLGSGCGGGASIRGTDTAGKLTLGTDNTNCVLTFSTVFTNPPACMAMNETNGGAHAVVAGVKSTVATLTFDAPAPWSDGDTIAYTCSTY